MKQVLFSITLAEDKRYMILTDVNSLLLAQNFTIARKSGNVSYSDECWTKKLTIFPLFCAIVQFSQMYNLRIIVTTSHMIDKLEEDSHL